MQLQLQWASTTQTLDGNGECEQWQWASTTQTLGGNGECEQCAHCLSYTFANAYTIPHRYAHTRILTRKHAHTHIHVHTHHACNATYLDDRQKLSWSAADWSRSATNKCIKHVTVGIILIRYQSWIASIVVARNIVARCRLTGCLKISTSPLLLPPSPAWCITLQCWDQVI